MLAIETSFWSLLSLQSLKDAKKSHLHFTCCQWFLAGSFGSGNSLTITWRITRRFTKWVSRQVPKHSCKIPFLPPQNLNVFFAYERSGTMTCPTSVHYNSISFKIREQCPTWKQRAKQNSSRWHFCHTQTIVSRLLEQPSRVPSDFKDMIKSANSLGNSWTPLQSHLACATELFPCKCNRSCCKLSLELYKDSLQACLKAIWVFSEYRSITSLKDSCCTSGSTDTL